MRAAGPALGLLVLLTGLGSECAEPPPLRVPARTFDVELVDEGAEEPWRSQPGPLTFWDGTDETVYIQMLSAEAATARVEWAEDPERDLPDTTVFLDAPGRLNDLSGRVDSQGLFAQRVVQGEYDVLVAPGQLTSGAPAVMFRGVQLNGEAVWTWALPEPVLVRGDVRDEVTGTPLPGMVITLYQGGHSGLPNGVTTVTDGQGEWTLLTNPGLYEVVVSPPSDGSVPWPAATAVLEFPLLAGATASITYPSLPRTRVSGFVTTVGGSPFPARVRVEGRVDAVPGVPSTFDGGRWIAEAETTAQGAWEFVVPTGEYSIRATPKLAERAYGVGRTTFSVPAGVEQIADIEVLVPASRLARVSVTDEAGAAVGGARVYLRSLLPPRYAYSETTEGAGAQAGAWIGLLPQGVYEVEVVPPTDSEGEKTHARAHAVLDLTEGDPSVDIALRRSDPMVGKVFSRDEEGADDVRVLLLDPETGDLLDTTVTNRDEYPGFFEAILPR